MEDKYITRKTLLQRAVDPNDEGAWTEFVGYYKTFIFMLLRNMNVSLSDCEDLTQNILVRIWKKLESYDPERAKFRTWLSTIIRNEVLSHYDKHQRIQNKHDGFRVETEHGVPALNEFDKLFEREWATYITNMAMQRVKVSFSGHAMEVFELTLDGVAAEQIAEKLDIKVFTVYALRNRVKKKIKEEVAALQQELEL
jgi:RNA polymerase sigma factor (sigma-70 family)